jgi:hypothetical protein
LRTAILSAWLALSTAAFADADRRYAILSLVGDKITVVARANVTGSPRDRNTKQVLPLPTREIDDAAALAVEAELRRLDPKAAPILLAARDPALHAEQQRMLDEDSTTAALLGSVRALAAEAGATHLLLVAKLRHEATLRVADGSTGSGKVDGVGFYIDRTLRMRRSDTGQVSEGYLAPFAYFSVSLIDLRSGEILGREHGLASITLSAARSARGDPWDALSAEQKVRSLQSLIRRETARIVPALLR